MTDVVLERRIKRLIVIRLLFLAFFLSLGGFFFVIDRLVFYWILSVLSILSLFYSLWLWWGKALRWSACVQIGMDLLAVTITVHYTGGVDSVMATLYVLIILSAGLLFNPLANVITAAISSLLFCSIVALEFFDRVPSILPPVRGEFLIARDLVYVLYMLYVRVVIFLLIGFLTGFSNQIFGWFGGRATDKNLPLVHEIDTAMREGFIFYIAHEIKNPLTSILGSIELLCQGLQSKINDKQRMLVNAVMTESDRLKNLLDSILDYAREERLEIESLPLEEILDEIFILIEHGLKHEQRSYLVFEKPYRDKKIAVYADRNRVKQVFINLIHNAIQAMPEKGRLTVDAEETPTETRILFRDTGCGIDKKVMSRLFLPFRSNKKSGTGIGLAVAYKIVNRHGGKIRVKSKKGKGTTFMITLPRK